MDLAQFLKKIGVKAEAERVTDVVQNALRDPNASPSDLVEALAGTFNPNRSRVVVDSADVGEAGAAAKVVAFLVERGDIRIEGRRVCSTAKFAKK